MDRIDKMHARRLRKLLAQASAGGVGRLDARELMLLPRLYRHVSSLLARLDASGHDAKAQAEVRKLVHAAHGLLYQKPRRTLASALRRTVTFLLYDSPRAIRAEWKILTAAFAVFYGLTILSYVAVARDLELAFTLFDPKAVLGEIEQLRSTAEGEPFRGNFTFEEGESAGISGFIIGNNIRVAVMAFGAGLIPPILLFVMVTNALMLGTYTAVASHWGQATEISSILWCHGTIELQMIVLAGASGLVLARGIVAPGVWSRGHAMALEGRRAFAMMAPVAPFLFLSGLIEGFISPHAPTPVRLLVAAATGALLVGWLWTGCRNRAQIPGVCHAQPSRASSSSAASGPKLPAA